MSSHGQQVKLLGARLGLAASAGGAAQRGCLHIDVSCCTWSGVVRQLLREVGEARLCLCITVKGAMLVLHIISCKPTGWARKKYFQFQVDRTYLCLVRFVHFLTLLQVTTPDDMAVAEAFLKVWELAVKPPGPGVAQLPVTVLAAEVQGDGLPAPAVL